MYIDELSREAKLIVQGRQAYVQNAAALWACLVAWFGAKA